MNVREQLVHWRGTGNACAPYTATHGGHALALRIGDFPAEHLYMLIVDGVEVASFSDWPGGWERPIMPPPEGDNTESDKPS